MKSQWKGIIGLIITAGILNFTTRATATEESAELIAKRARGDRILELLNDVASPSSTNPEEEKAHISRVLRLYELEFGNGESSGKKATLAADEQTVFLDLTDSIEQ